jgi:hypothetical protein
MACRRGLVATGIDFHQPEVVKGGSAMGGMSAYFFLRDFLSRACIKSAIKRPHERNMLI